MTRGARFDDLRTLRAYSFPPPQREVVATRSSEVIAVLDEVERLTSRGKWAWGFMGYEAASGLDPELVAHDPVPGLPLAWFGIGDAPRRVGPIAPTGRLRSRPSWTIGWDSSDHRRAVETIRSRIAAGETYQCNLTTQLTASAPDHVERLYEELALAQGGAHNALLDTGRFVIASASPELFLELRGDQARMRPMKGTAPRGGTPAEDVALVRRLRDSAKERAENIMIVDLVRNDLARIAVPGTVQVPRLLRVEHFATVHQLTSDVTAKLRPGTGLSDIFRALFPCGSVTGAPKARTMELIREVETGPRGVYCGAIGMVGPPGCPVRARFSVAIRTVLIDRAVGTATFGTGGGITWASDPAAEYEEMLVKTRVLGTALKS